MAATSSTLERSSPKTAAVEAPVPAPAEAPEAPAPPETPPAAAVERAAAKAMPLAGLLQVQQAFGEVAATAVFAMWAMALGQTARMAALFDDLWSSPLDAPRMRPA
jgi:hypothetical protein